MYRKNPIFLFGHDYRSPWAVMGRAVRIEKDTDAGELNMDVLFMNKDLNPIAEMVYQMYAHRPPFLNAVSVGFIPLKTEEIKEIEQEKLKQSGPKRKAYLKFVEQELLELSAVTVPANPNAVGKGAGLRSAIDYLNSLKGQFIGVDPVQLMVAQTVLSDASERGQLQERMECWMEQEGLMVPCACNVREMIDVSTFVSAREASLGPVIEEQQVDIQQRVGAVLNAKNKNALSQAKKSMADAAELIQNVLDSAGDEEEDEQPPQQEKEEVSQIDELLREIRSGIQDCYEILRVSSTAPEEPAVEDEPDEEPDEEAARSLENLDSILNEVLQPQEVKQRLTKVMGEVGAKLAHLALKP